MTTYYIGSDPSDDYTSWAAMQGSVQEVAGDTVSFRRGEIFREQITVPNSGTSGNRITYTSHGTGVLPKIYGSVQVSTWINESGNIWYAPNGADPQSVWFINTDTTITWGKKEANKVDLTAEYEWWWDSGNSRIYVYAASDNHHKFLLA